MASTSTGQVANTPEAYGQSIKASDSPNGIAKFSPVHSEQLTQRLPKEQLLPAIQVIRRYVAAIRDTFTQLTETRMVGGSLSIIYELLPWVTFHMWLLVLMNLREYPARRGNCQDPDHRVEFISSYLG